VGTSAVLDESLDPVVALASAASGAASLGASLAFASSVSLGTYGATPYGTAGAVEHSVLATAVPIAPAKSAARDKRPASTRVGPISTLAVAPQNGQVPSPRLT
jgi:hypothetical protein